MSAQANGKRIRCWLGRHEFEKVEPVTPKGTGGRRCVHCGRRYDFIPKQFGVLKRVDNASTQEER